MRVLGFMTGTSLDAVDMAVLETDGETIAAFGPAREQALSQDVREMILLATAEASGWRRDAPIPASARGASDAVVREHFEAGAAFLAANGLTWRDLDLIGMHGQTVLHERPANGAPGRSIQLGDAEWLARETGRPVAHDFRAADIAAGGEGAPIAPIYHAALVKRAGLDMPIGVLNLGGVANITLVDSETLTGFDTGPANGMIDQWVQERLGLRFDADGRVAAAGKVDDAALARLLDHPHFSARGPKSLDRFQFSLDPVRALSVVDAAATLTAFAAEAVARALSLCAVTPHALIVCGGGRRNPALMRALRERAVITVKTAEDVGWRGDAIEAEAIAFLAARCANNLPITFPGTTGAPAPMTGGRIVRP